MDLFKNNGGNIRPLIVFLIIFLLLAAFNTCKKVENMSSANIIETNKATQDLYAENARKRPNTTGEPQGVADKYVYAKSDQIRMITNPLNTITGFTI